MHRGTELFAEFLLSFIVLMHISFVASRPVGGDLQGEVKGLELPLCDLIRAENGYVKHIFKGEYNLSSLEPLEGITRPVGNTTEELQDSICAINDYLENLPAIIRNVTQQHREDLISSSMDFHEQFKALVEPGRCQNIRWHPNITTSHDYAMKELGLRIIYFTKKWVEHFIKPFCNL